VFTREGRNRCAAARPARPFPFATADATGATSRPSWSKTGDASIKSIPALKPRCRRGARCRSATGGRQPKTQFATLGMGRTGRQGVPMERGHRLLAKRFQASQTKTGGWGYIYGRNPGSGETAVMDRRGPAGRRSGTASR